jgi:hypothetical protein
LEITGIEGKNHHTITAGFLLGLAEDFGAATTGRLLGGGLFAAGATVEDDIIFAEAESEHGKPQRDEGDHREGKSGS